MKNKIISVVILLVNFALSLILYPKLPDKMATHWGASSEVNGYMSKGLGVFFLPLLLVGLYLLLYYAPKIDPRKENIIKFRKEYDMFLIIFLLFMMAMNIYTLSWNLGYHFNINIFISIALAILFYAIGGLVKSAEPNYFIGIRTPWTLANDKVWSKTHIIGAKLFKGAAVLCLLGIFRPTYAMYIILGSVLIAAFGSVIYSYFEFRKINRN